MSRDPNLLAYTSDALKTDVVVAGPISVHLAAATSAVDTDWYAVLEDVYPDGKSAGLVQGIIQARFRKSFEKPTLLKPGETADYTIDLWALGQVFKTGHRIRVTVTSSCFPIYARNLNTGEDNLTGTKSVIAHQTVFTPTTIRPMSSCRHYRINGNNQSRVIAEKVRPNNDRRKR